MLYTMIRRKGRLLDVYISIPMIIKLNSHFHSVEKVVYIYVYVCICACVCLFMCVHTCVLWCTSASITLYMYCRQMIIESVYNNV